MHSPVPPTLSTGPSILPTMKVQQTFFRRFPETFPTSRTLSRMGEFYRRAAWERPREIACTTNILTVAVLAA